MKEINIKQTKSDIDSATRGRKGKYTTRFNGLDSKNQMTWGTESASRPGLIHRQNIQFEDLDIALGIEDADLRPRDRVRLAMAGDIKVNCTCEEFKFFGYAFITSQLDMNSGPQENRAPNVRNPSLEGIVCRHLALVLDTAPFHQSDVVQALKGKGAF